MQNWKITHNKYLSDNIYPKLRFAYWEGHRDFVYDLTSFVSPACITELGSQYGCSLFTFCQSVKENHLNTVINAIDLWKGDIGAEHPGEEVFNIVKKIKEEYFSDLKLNLYQAKFDDVLNNFKDGSIDILHIDGGHTYEEVRHDFLTWLPKLSDNGIVLFHDVYSPIEDGACIYWTELKNSYSNWIEFKHSCGLGILFPKKDFWFKKILDTNFVECYQPLYYYRASYEITKLRFDELSELYVKRFDAIQEQSKMINERDTVIQAQAKLLEERYSAIQEQSKMIEERDAEIQAQAEFLEERYSTIQEQSKMVEERDTEIQAQARFLEERYSTIQEQSKMIDERDNTIQEQSKMIDERDNTIREQFEILDRNKSTILSQRKEIEGLSNDIMIKDSIIKSLEEIIDSCWITKRKRKKSIKEK